MRRTIEASITARLVFALFFFHAAPTAAGLVLVGESTDLDRLKEVLSRCAGDCAGFDELLASIHRDEWKVTLHVGSDLRFVHVGPDSTRPFDIIFEGFLGHGSQAVDIDELALLPPAHLEVEPGSDIREVPAWASTDCSMLAHALAEALHGAQFGQAGYLECHERGIEVENKVRACFATDFEVDRAWCEQSDGTRFLCYKTIGPYLEVIRVRDGRIESIDYQEEPGVDSPTDPP